MSYIQKALYRLMLTLTLSPSNQLWAQDTLSIFPSAREITVSVTGVVVKMGQEFQYSYRVQNHEESKQNIFELYIQHDSDVYDIFAPDGWEGLPSNVVRRVVMWGSNDSTYDISPKGQLGRFAFKSLGLPSLVLFFARGAFTIPVFPEGEAPDSIAGSDIFENSAIGKTIGPVPPPSPFIPLAFLDTLISYTRQAFALGWIKNRDIVQDLNAELNDAKRQLRRNNKTEAKEILRDFIDEVKDLWEEEEDQRRKPLTSEAYALLKFNAEYLISKL